MAEKKYRISEEGKAYIKQGFPEKLLLDRIKSSGGAMPMETAKAMPNFSIALNWAKKNAWISLEAGKLKIVAYPHTFSHAEALNEVSIGNSIDEKIAKELVSRKLLEESRETESVRAMEQIKQKEVSALTPELIKTGLWRKVSLRHYNVESTGKPIAMGKKHILTLYQEKIRKIFLDMGFSESSGPMIESSFWNFDALFQPQDHPARDMADTFYMKNPREAKLPDKAMVEKVKKTHENGWSTGSSGWGYEWSPGISKKPILRTHTTAVSARMLSKIRPPAKVFCMGRVFRNETIDYKHLVEFTQVEGIVADENANFRNLLGYLKEFYNRLGFDKVRFRPAYFPYTEMSVEPEVYFEEKGEWMEMGGSGIFRPEVTKPLGIDCPVLAWGLSLERPIMLKLGLNDIRNFYYKNDLELLRKAVLWQ